MATETKYADGLTSGSVSTPANANGAPDGTFTTDSGLVSWTARFSMQNPVGTQANGTHTFTARVRKYSGTGNPVLNSITIYEGSTSRVVKTLNTSVTSATGQDVSTTLTEAEIRTITNLANLEVQIVTTGAGGSGPARAAVQLDAITWSGDITTPPPPGPPPGCFFPLL